MIEQETQKPGNRESADRTDPSKTAEPPSLQDLRSANQAITRFVSELSLTKTSRRPHSYSIQFESLRGQVKKIEGALGLVPPSGLRSPELEMELTTYAVNLGLLKKAIEEFGPLLKKEMQVVRAEIARLGAASSWSAALKDLSK